MGMRRRSGRSTFAFDAEIADLQGDMDVGGSLASAERVGGLRLAGRGK